MLLNRFYFRLKPLIPRSIRLGVRRWFVLRKRRQVEDVWPIVPGSERAPTGWPGWPNGKKFALVLTHDVESEQGIALPLREAVRFFGSKNLEQIVQAIGECDLGIIPNRRSIFTELNTPTRIFEYLSQGKPVIAPRAPGILDYFGPEELILFELGDAADLAAKIEYVFKNPKKIDAIIERAQEVYRAHAWNAERPRFIELTDELLRGASPEWVQNRPAPVLGARE